MGNLFAARIHELQTVITNQIGIALIRGFNERLGSEFTRIMLAVSYADKAGRRSKKAFPSRRSRRSFPSG